MNMIFIYLYNIIEILKGYSSKWYIKPYIWYNKRKLRKRFSAENIRRMPLTKNFLLGLMQFSDLTGIFEIMDRERLVMIKISDKLVITMPTRNNKITVKFTDLDTTFMIVTKEYDQCISINNTQFKDANAIKLENMIYDAIYEKVTEYILFADKIEEDREEFSNAAA